MKKAKLHCAAKGEHDNRNTAAGSLVVVLDQGHALVTAQAIANAQPEDVPGDVSLPGSIGWGHPVRIQYESGKTRDVVGE